MQTTSTVPRNWLFDWVDFDLTSEAFGLACFLGRHAGSRPALHLWLHLCLLTVRWIGNVEALRGHESNAGFMMSHAAVVRSWQIMVLCSKKRASPTRNAAVRSYSERVCVRVYTLKDIWRRKWGPKKPTRKACQPDIQESKGKEARPSKDLPKRPVSGEICVLQYNESSDRDDES